MEVNNIWKEVTLTIDTNTIIQNLTKLTLLVKFEDIQPVNDIDAIYMAYRTVVNNSILDYANDRGKMWVRVLEELEPLETRNITIV